MHAAHFKKLIIFIFVSVYYVNLSFSSSAKIEAITTPRQWKNTLNFIITTDLGTEEINMDHWIEENKMYINEEKQHAIQRIFRHPGSPVISKGRIILFYRNSDSPQIKVFIVEINNTFISSMRQKSADSDPDNAISSFYFYRREGIPDGKIFNDQQRTAIAQLIGDETAFITDGTHSEATFLLFLKEKLSEIFEALLEHEREKEIILIGAITQLLTLKDSCIGCGMMLESFSRNLKNILTKNIISFPNIRINDFFESLVLTAGVSNFMESRRDIDVSEEPTMLTFGEGSERALFSTGDMREHGRRIEEIFPYRIHTITY